VQPVGDSCRCEGLDPDAEAPATSLC